MRMNRGIWILALVATLVTLGNVFATTFFYVLMCFDSCLDVGAAITSGQLQSLTALLLPLAALIPSLAMILAAWIWELVELRRINAERARIFVALFPLVVLIVGVAVILLTSVTSPGAVVVRPFNIWSGSLALALWPLLVALVGLFWRRSAPSSPATPVAASG